MLITLNFEAPGRDTTNLTIMITELFVASAVKIRAQLAAYEGACGAVTFIARIDTPLSVDAVKEAVFALSCKLDEDCIAVVFHAPGGSKHDALVGPRADKWGAFDTAAFVKY